MPKVEFEIVLDKEKESDIQKIKRWIKKQKPPLNIILEYLFSYVEKWYFDFKVKQTMLEVDRQAEDIKQQWKEEENNQIVQKFQEENPDAKVTLHDSETGAVLIEHQSDGSNAQELLGGTMEIKSPWSETKNIDK